MGQYNPHAPYVLGEEWVPIRNAHYVPDGVVERGYTFRLDAVTVPVSGAYYVNEIPDNVVSNACDFIAVYPSGYETLTGPVKKLTIPASAVAVANPGSIDISEGVAALLSPLDPIYIMFQADTGILSELRVNFDTNAYAALLLGKRVVDVRLRYSFISENLANANNVQLKLVNPSSGNSISYPQILEMTHPDAATKISSFSIGELTPLWDATATFNRQRTVLPWRFQELNRLRSGAAAGEQLTVSMFNSATEFAAFLNYLAVEVFYCEETRVLYGGFRTYDAALVPAGVPLQIYNVGAIAAQLYAPTTHTQGATLTAGEYVVTVYHRDLATRSVLQGAPRIHAVREYYQLPAQRGIHVRQTTIENAQFTSEPTDVLTQITLHTATQVVTGVHPYGTSYGAPVYGSRTVTQEIEDDPGSAASYPQVRFYARRYGETTIPLTLTDVATGLSTVSISVADFDALDEIVDGWREVTLRFATAPTFPPTAGDVDWRWSATNELVGNQWQIMVADGPSGSWGPSPAAAATGPATYWAPLGSQVALTWQSPSVSGVAEDTTSDAVLIFSQDPPAVTGFALEVLTQQLDVAVGCDATPRCAPTALSYVSATWDYDALCDTFSRVVDGEWGTADSGQDTSTSGGTAVNYYVDDVGVLQFSAADQELQAIYNVALRDLIIRGEVESPVAPTGAGNVEIKIIARYVDAINYVDARIFLNVGGVVTCNVRQVVAGVETASSFPTVANVTTTTPLNYVFYVVGTTLKLQIWAQGTVEPVTWNLTLTTTTQNFVGVVKLGGYVSPAVSNGSAIMHMFDDLTAVDPAAEGVYLELQRYDAVDAEWKTIMLSSTPCPHSFADYEARVGVVSQYRLRTCNVLDFCGPWVTGSATVPSPGVSIAGSASGMLIFTSNEQPGSNLAYVKQFEGQPTETFTFPEADTVALQRLFGRDFFLAVRPLERGGERFAATLLINQAAIAPPSLANFTGLRDLAWADLNYVCVRDELGNRWFATVIVPDGTVRGDRTIYLARIEVVQVTNTPTQVDP